MKLYFSFEGILIILFAILIYFTGVFTPYWGYELELGILKFPIFLFLLYLGIKKFAIPKKKNKIIEYSKCPNCKETYIYTSLKDGLCPKCDIKTIDIEKYYDKKENEGQNEGQAPS